MVGTGSESPSWSGVSSARNHRQCVKEGAGYRAGRPERSELGVDAARSGHGVLHGAGSSSRGRFEGE